MFMALFVPLSSSLNDVAEMQQKLFAGRSEPRPGSGRTTQREAEAFTVPPLPGVELGSSEAISDQSSDTESTSDLSTESLVPSRAGTWRHRARAIDSEVERPPAVSGRVRLAGEPCRPEEGRKPGLPLRPQEAYTSTTAGPADLGGDEGLHARPKGPPPRPQAARARRHAGSWPLSVFVLCTWMHVTTVGWLRPLSSGATIGGIGIGGHWDMCGSKGSLHAKSEVPCFRSM
ncbi:unnamed protein product [Prorocentrum cordatum]|uniref:Uncharacterized protein n=1 Tax=Prorocentrum cordatum TaxID=2364126 RepID=A0ABN9SRS1_9DINO|nr:unnamed protein product [Polarella glacialis]